MRLLVLLGLLVALAVGGPAATAVDVPAPRNDLVHALRVLHGWDASRERAWAAADEKALRSLYVRGSASGRASGRADVRLLRAYTRHGLVVRRIVTQVFAVKVLGRGAGTLRLRVLDRVAGGQVLHGAGAMPLGSSAPVTRVIELRFVAGRWLVASVSGSERGPREAPRRRRDH
jgi:hypothetical protein